jgi:TonB family protein
MLQPILDALAFVHGQDLVQGQLKPANVLVVGDQLKLASDTIRRVGESPVGANAAGASLSTAGDIWSLGACLFEALTRRAPPGLSERGEAVALPLNFSPAFKDMVSRCLNPSPQKRPSVTQLEAWARGQALSDPPEAAAPTQLKPVAARITRPSLTPDVARPVPPLAQSRRPRISLIAMLGAGVILALVWAGVRIVGSHGTPPAPPVLQAPTQTPDASAPAAADVAKPIAVATPLTSNGSGAAGSTLALQEMIPEVPESLRRSIRGHDKVWVRVTVDPDGSVIAASADRSGRSSDLLHLALDAAWKWKFPAVDTQSRRKLQLRFNFSRDDTTARAIALH